jgi:hypothetical protein
MPAYACSRFVPLFAGGDYNRRISSAGGFLPRQNRGGKNRVVVQKPDIRVEE